MDQALQTEHKKSKQKRNKWLFLLAFLSFVGGGVLVTTIPPDVSISVSIVTIPAPVIFFIILFLFLFSFVSWITRQVLQGAVIAVFGTIFLLIRFFGFTRPLYQLLLLAIFIAVELFFLLPKNK